MVWVIAGSYYIRSGTQDPDEAWGEFLSWLSTRRALMTRMVTDCAFVGLLTHDWSAFRDPADVNKYLKPMVAATVNS
jgi:hypothetical protein